MRIVGYHISGKVAANSDGEQTTRPPYLDFLLQEKPDTIKIFHHLEYAVANLARLVDLTEEECKTLWQKRQLGIPPYVLKHAPNRFLSIKKGGYFSVFADAGQYRKAVLSENESVDECVAKAKEAQKTGEDVYQALRSMGLNPTSIVSPIKAYDSGVLSKMDLPTAKDIPEEAGFYAYNCIRWGWRDCLQVGHWNKVWQYDLSSAFSSELVKLLDTRYGRWVESDRIIPEATYGFCSGIVSIASPLSPVILFSVKGNMRLGYTPTGKWRDYLTLDEIRFIDRWKLGSFKLEKGHFWIADKKVRPLEGAVNRLYHIKEHSDGVARDMAKKVSNAIWGYQCQTKKQKGEEGFGDRFNPVWGAQVEPNIRLRTAEFALKAGVEHNIHIAVDETILDKPVELEGNGGMGEWRLKMSDACLVMGTGAVAIKGKEKSTDFAISYDWLMERIRNNPEAEEYTLEAVSPITLGVAMNEGLFDGLGRLRKVTKRLPVGNEGKRYYPERPKCGGDLLTKTYASEPWDISLVNKLV